MTREEILENLRQLGEELDALGMMGEILLTGGAAMCLVHDARDMTKDVDALYEPKPIINKLAWCQNIRTGRQNIDVVF